MLKGYSHCCGGKSTPWYTQLTLTLIPLLTKRLRILVSDGVAVVISVESYEYAAATLVAVHP
jgi:hypothetical protein